MVKPQRSEEVSEKLPITHPPRHINHSTIDRMLGCFEFFQMDERKS